MKARPGTALIRVRISYLLAGLFVGSVLVPPVGCGDPPRRVRVIDQVDADGSYTTHDVELQTVTDLREVRGEAAQLFGNATLYLDRTLLVDDGGSRDAVVEDETPVHARWIVEGDVAVPSDFDSLNLLSAYAHLEAAALAFRDLDVAIASEPVPTYYHPRVESGLVPFPSSDNAAYFANIDGFLLLPMKILQDIPFPMNPGVMTHEYSHRVFYAEAWDSDMFGILADVLTDPSAQPTWNLLRSVDEGVADYFGAVITGNPAFIEDSVYPAIAEPRDLAELRAIEPAWLEGFEPTQLGAYDPYAAGAVLASMLWAFGEGSGTGAVSAAIIEAERRLAVRLHGAFAYAVGDFETDVIDALPDGDRAALCERAELGYAAAWTAFTAVCP